MTRRVLIICGGGDSAGTGQALKSSLDKYGVGWDARMVRRKNTWLDYPADITWHRRDRVTGRKVQKLFAAADVVHVMQTTKVLREFPGWRSKTIVVAQIGTYLRDDPAGVSKSVADIGGTLVVNSLELLNLAPQAELLMWTVDLNMLAALRREHWKPDPTGRVRIYHSPTNRAIKSTAAFLEATERLARRYPIDVQLVEGVPWAENLRRKAQADIVFDEVTLGYGLNSAEAWAMGMPALVGLEDPGARQLFMDRYGGFPYPDTTESTIEERLEELIVDVEARHRWGEIGRRFVNEVHAESVVAPQTVALYERLLAQKAAA